VRLRLEALSRLPDLVSEIVLVGHGVRVEAGQAELFDVPRRDPRAAARALARVRAELGDEAVRRPVLREGHLPEASFEWLPAGEIRSARPREAAPGTLVRRIWIPPLPLPGRERHEPDGWMPRGLEQGPVVRVLGPYVVSGGWWQRRVHREYHFAETQRGELLWVFYDRPRRRWYLQGRVE
jgi:protein ImuB